jgi:pyrimidine operon attenuation protein / uracil phosphoribosyltransferase
LSSAGVSADKVLLDAEAIQRSLARIAHEIIEGNPELENVALVGIHTRGVPLAQRLRRLVADFSGEEVRLGTVDITFYRDDVHVRGGEAPLHSQPVVRATKLDFPLEGMTCILVDDVLYTGRTGPTTSARTCRPPVTSASRCSSSRSTRSTASC